MRIKGGWDSGPYGFWYPAHDGDPEAFEVDEEIYKRYCAADKAKDEAEDELRAAEEAHRADKG